MKKELKEKFQNVYLKNYSKSLLDFCMKKLSNGYELDNGFLIEFEKPDIKKEFCFGVGYNGSYTDTQYDEASRMVKIARTNEKYFINENMEELEEIEKKLNKNEDLYIVINEYGFANIRHLKDSYYFKSEFAREYEEKNKRQLNKKDKEILKEILKEEKVKFLKRLNTYLKKYGLSKIHSWTYLCD